MMKNGLAIIKTKNLFFVRSQTPVPSYPLLRYLYQTIINFLCFVAAPPKKELFRLRIRNDFKEFWIRIRSPLFEAYLEMVKKYLFVGSKRKTNSYLFERNNPPRFTIQLTKKRRKNCNYIFMCFFIFNRSGSKTNNSLTFTGAIHRPVLQVQLKQRNKNCENLCALSFLTDPDT